ncbi:hypothetical protein EZV73_00560 [Acidaminobacter sp. JC074]|uniref:YczE/YyaS/YitT family protein n=1 Tax=Acidaminobacter sp. JC074 TaxID=2530199 RepID=UPI001F10F17E|nr:hypothetical protein [Acidaminobacter sp. JC074]MCH4886031.1 hypothetical protein [Acidaminobacter sp. JC074]
MKKRLFNLILGLFICSVGITMTIQANIGYAPWDVFHAGLANLLNTTIGLASIVAGLLIVIIVSLFGEKLGVGTILNMVLIGLFIDIIRRFNIIPQADNFLISLIMLILGLFILSVGSYFYIGSGFGAGPRDNLMVVLRRKTGLPVGVSRVIVELAATLVGWRLGGQLGIGTLIAAFSIGFCIQTTFKVLNFNTTHVKHQTIKDTIDTLNDLRSAS